MQESSVHLQITSFVVLNAVAPKKSTLIFGKTMCNIHIVNIVISIKKEGVTKRKKRAWWKQKSERIAQRKFGGFRISYASL